MSLRARWGQRAIGHLGWLRGGIGAAMGIGLAGAVTMLLVGGRSGALPFLVAPLGASAVLVFCVPASPMAQPWTVIGGDLLSAVVGLAAGRLLHDPWLAGSIGVGSAIAAMSLARCMHPPGGACALLCALGATGEVPWDASYMLPIAANVLLLCGFGWVFNNLTGHPWPHRPPCVPAVLHRAYSREDIAEVLAEWDEVLDVDIDDLDAFVQALLRKGARGR